MERGRLINHLYYKAYRFLQRWHVKLGLQAPIKKLYFRGLSSPTFNLRKELTRLKKVPRVIKGKSLNFMGGPQFFSAYILTPKKRATQVLFARCTVIAPGGRSQKHGHMNEAIFYILDGKGHEIHDGVRYDWEAGDIVVVENACVHQHFNDDPDRPARAIIIHPMPLYLFMNMVMQDDVEPQPNNPVPGHDDFEPTYFPDIGPQKSRFPMVLFEESKKAYIRKAEADYYEKKLEHSKIVIEKNTKKQKIIKPESMPWEKSRQGIIKHICNDRMDVQIESVDAFMQFIPPGSCSGRHRHMSEEYIFVLEGKGYDLHWDVNFELGERYLWKVDKKPSRWEWEQGDSIYIPPNTVHQHFNADFERHARFISATSRMVSYIGFDDLEQIENAPEYEEKILAEKR